MNKTAIRNFAIWARNKLIADISYKAGLMGITKDGIADALPQSTSGVEFYDIGTAEPYAIRGEEIEQRKDLVQIIKQKEKETDYITAYNSVIEEVAYTWFNRLIAVRFMEVNDYMPSHIRVLSSETGKLEPDLVTSPFDAELDLSDAEKQQIIQLKNDNKLDVAFRLLFIKQCNALHGMLSRLFENTCDYSELLLNVSFVDQDGVVYHLVHDIDEDDFNIEKGGQIEIIGWLYQFYNTELKDETFALLKNNVKMTKERIPSATQLFTPDWIVRYMVENSLGRLWLNGHPNDALKINWKYYLEDVNQEKDLQIVIGNLNSKYEKITPEEIKLIDPCMGSGHILVYAFDVLMQIYESVGYTQRDAAKSIIENNIFGLDIDERAAQLSYFAVLMKARQYNRRILNDYVKCNVYAVRESNSINRSVLERLGDVAVVAEKLINAFDNAKEYGSIIRMDVSADELDALDRRVSEIRNSSNYENLIDALNSKIILERLVPLILQAEIMISKYSVVVTNPPYMSSSGMNSRLLEYVKKNYVDSKGDLSTCFMEKCCSMTQEEIGFCSMINIPVWMFQSSYEQLRKKLYDTYTITSLVHFGRGVFGSDFGTVAFTIRNISMPRYNGVYLRLYEKQGAVENIEIKEKKFLEKQNIYISNQAGYERIPGLPLAYWVTENVIDSFKNKNIKAILSPKQGTSTGDDERFVRIWTEIDYTTFSDSQTSCEKALSSGFKFFPLNKGGEYRKWYGNNEKVIKFDQASYNQLLEMGNHLPSRDLYFKKGITWSKITAAKTSFRYDADGFIFSSVGLKGFPSDDNIYYCLGYLNSIVVEYYINIIAPGFSTVSGDIEKLPFIASKNKKDSVDGLVTECIEGEKEDWDSFETSWDFKKHPLI